MKLNKEYKIEYEYKGQLIKVVAVFKETIKNLFRFKTDHGYNTLFTTTLLLLSEDQIKTIEEV